MKPKDLMVGDKVFLFGEMLVEVDCIGNVEVYLIDTEGIDWRVTYEHIKPIPITPEILVKNGWAYNYVDKVFYPAQFRDELPWMVGKNGVFRVRNFCEIRYVHELQHALRLCGLEKEIII